MAELTTLARPYAKAAFDFAKNAGEVNQWQEYLAFAAGLLKNAEFAEYLSRPDMTADKQLDAVVKVSNDSFTEFFKNFLSQLAQNARLPLLPAIRDEFELLKSASDNELVAEVETAFALTDEQSSSLQAVLEKHFGNTVVMNVEVNPELLAGAVIRVGDQVIDDSAKGRLKKLKTKLAS